MGENIIDEEWNGEPLSQEEIFDIIVVDAEICKKEQVLKDTGEEYHYLNHMPDDERGKMIESVVRETMKDYENPTRGMTDAQIKEFDFEMKKELKQRYGNNDS